MSDVLVFSGVSIERDGRPVLAGIDLSLRKGEVVALIGPNGAGKSTLLLATLGRLPYRGSIRVAGAEIRSIDARTRSHHLGYVPQRGSLRAPLSVAQVVAAGRFSRGGMLARLSNADQQAITAALRDADVQALADRRFDRLSCGEQQRVLLARALATEAPVLLLDEPTAGLDPGHALALLALVRRIAASGRSVVVAMHHLDEVAQVADRVVLVHDGRAAVVGTPTEVLTEPWLRSAYGVEPLPGSGLGLRLVAGR